MNPYTKKEDDFLVPMMDEKDIKKFQKKHKKKKNNETK